MGRDESTEQPRRRWGVLLACLALVVGAIWWMRNAATERGQPTADADTAAATAGASAEKKFVRASGLLDPSALALGSVHGTVRDADDHPIAGARVCARGSNDELPTGAFFLPTCDLTDDGGRYHIEGLLPAGYSVGVMAKGFLPTARSVGANPRVDAPTIQLAAGESRSGVDFVLARGGVRLAGHVYDVTGGAIEGAWVTTQNGYWTPTDASGAFEAWVTDATRTVAAAAPGYAHGFSTVYPPTDQVELYLTAESILRGRVVVAGSGEPVANIGVYIVGNVGWPPASITDEEGRFTVEGRPPGRYELEARSDEYYGRTARDVAAGLAETREDIEIEVHAAVSLEGSVFVAGSGAPCPSGKVELAHEAGMTHADWFSEGDGGQFLVSGLVPGTYRAIVACDGHRASEDYDPIVIDDAPPAPVVFEVDPGLTVSGRVLDGRGKPVAHASLQAVPKYTDGKPGRPTIAESEPDGSYVLSGLSSEVHGITVTDAPTAPTPSETVEVDLSPGTDVDDFDIELRAGASLQGRVVDTRGRPVVDARVEPIAPRAMDFAWGLRKQGRTDQTGHYRVEGLGPGAYRVHVGRSMSETFRHPGQGPEDPAGVAVNLAQGESKHLDIEVVATDEVITGSVTSTGGPVTDAFIHYARMSDRAGANDLDARFATRWRQVGAKPIVTDQDGDFRIEGLQEGRYTIRVDRKGGGEAFAEGVRAGEHVNIEIEETGAIEGKVVVPGGELPQTVSLELHDRAHDRSFANVTYRSGGRFAFERVPAGNYKIVAETSLGSSISEVALKSGEHKKGVIVEVSPTHDVRGRLVDLETKAPLPGLVVYAMGHGDDEPNWENEPSPHRTTGTDGRFTLHDVPSGKVVFIVVPRNITSSLPEYGMLSLVRTLEPEPADQDVGDVPLPRRRVFGDDEPGELGYSLRSWEPHEQPEEARLEVSSVFEGGPAALAGLQVGDVIVSVDGHDVSAGDPNGWYGILTTVPPGTTVAFGVARDRTLKITARKRR